MPAITTPILSIEDPWLIESEPEFWHQGALVVREYQFFTDDSQTTPLDMTGGTIEMNVSNRRGGGTNVATFTIGSGVEFIDQAQGRFRIEAVISYSGSAGFGLTSGGSVIGNVNGRVVQAIALPFDIDYVVGPERYRLFFGTIPYMRSVA